jgi:hypothetical protein
MPVGEESKMTDPNEPFGKDMQKEATQEFGGQQRHRFLFATMRVVLPTKRHALPIEGENPMIGDGYAMCVAAEVPQYLGGAAKRRLRIDNPVLLMQPAQELGKLLRIRQDRSRTSALQLFSAVEPFEAGDELTPEHAF